MGSSMVIKLEGDGAWPDLVEKMQAGKVIHIGNGSHIEVAALSGGMTSGRPSVMFRIDLPDGRTVMAETSMRLFLTAARAFEARYGAEAWKE